MLPFVLWLGLATLALAGAAVPLIVHLGFRAPRVRERTSPADFGLIFREVRIPTQRGRHLFGWWLPGAAHACTEALEREADELLAFLADAWEHDDSATVAGR